ncbi:hypothetical protein BBOR36S_02594 [Brevibacillus borstelensis]|jgi:hypothetical protein
MRMPDDGNSCTRERNTIVEQERQREDEDHERKTCLVIILA